MKIRKSQFANLDERAVDDFVERVAGMVRQQNQSLIPPGVDDAHLRTMVRHGIEKAKRYGLTWESSIGKFVGLMFGIAPNFDEHLAVQAILVDPLIAPNERVEELFRRLKPEQWEGAVRRYDMNAWPPFPR